MIRIAHLSDLHFGRHIPAVVKELRAEVERMRPTLVAISGDLTQRAKPSELAAAAELIASLPEPKLVVPGNHDLPAWRPLERFVAPWHNWNRHVGRELETSVRGPGFVAIGVKTARRFGLQLDWSRGRINGDQLARVRRLAAQSEPDALRVLVAHHPFLLGRRERQRGLVGRADAALRELSAAGVDLILGGHLHVSYTGVAGDLVISQAGTTTSNRHKGEPNAFNRIDASRDQIRIQAMQWQGEHFEPAECWSFHRRAGGWQVGPEWEASQGETRP